jgi:hypothetical protein
MIRILSNLFPFSCDAFIFALYLLGSRESTIFIAMQDYSINVPTTLSLRILLSCGCIFYICNVHNIPMHPHSHFIGHEGRAKESLLNVGVWGPGPSDHSTFVEAKPCARAQSSGSRRYGMVVCPRLLHRERVLANLGPQASRTK